MLARLDELKYSQCLTVPFPILGWYFRMFYLVFPLILILCFLLLLFFIFIFLLLLLLLPNHLIWCEQVVWVQSRKLLYFLFYSEPCRIYATAYSTQVDDCCLPLLWALSCTACKLLHRF